MEMSGWTLDVHDRYEFDNTWAVSSFFGGFCFSEVPHVVELNHWIKSSGFFWVFLCVRGMYACSCSYVYRCMCTCVLCRDSWGQYHMLFFSLPTTFLLRMGLSLAWNMFSWTARMAVHQALGSLLTLPPQHRGYKHALPCPAFCFSFFSPPFFSEFKFWGSNSGPWSCKACN